MLSEGVRVLLFLLAACGVDSTEAWDPTEGPFEVPPTVSAAFPAPPPTPLTLYVGAIRPGDPLTLTLTGLMPGETAHIGRAAGLGSGPCPPVAGGVCLGIDGSVTLVGTATADSRGVARRTVQVPGNVPIGASVGFQALVVRGPGGQDSLASNAVLGTSRTGPADLDQVAPGQLVITEIMNDPDAVADSAGEWFELTSLLPVPVDLDGLAIGDAGGVAYTVSAALVVPAGGRAVFARTGTSTNGGAPANVVYGSFSLGNGADSVRISYGGLILDEVAWDGGVLFPAPTGASMSLDPSATDAWTNDDGAAWCAATTPFGLGDAGTPGAPNGACGGTCANGAHDPGEDGVDCGGVCPVACGAGPGFEAPWQAWSVPNETLGGAGFYASAASYTTSGFWSVFDLDGDGLSDLVLTAPPNSNGTAVFGNGAAPYWKVYRNTGSGFASSPVAWPVPPQTMGGAGFYASAASYTTSGFWSVFDLTGDGRPDLVVTAPANSNGTEVYGNGTASPYWKVYANTGAGFDPTPLTWRVPTGDLGWAGLYTSAASYYTSGFWSTVDMDADGRPDLVVTAPANNNGAAGFGHGTAGAHWKVYRNTGSRFAASASTWTVPADDMGGAGFYTTGAAYTTSGFWSTVDMTGDGLLDLVVTAPANSNGTAVYGNGTASPYWRVYPGSATGFGAPVAWSVPAQTMGGSGFYTVGAAYYTSGFWSLMDLTSDGTPDLVVTAPANSNGTAVYGYASGSPEWKVYAGGPGGFDDVATSWSVPADPMGGAGFYKTSAAYSTSGFWSTLDLDGDGVLDLVVTAPADSNGTEVYGFGTGSPRWRHYAGQP